MTNLLDGLKGRKTYMLGGVLLAYVIVQSINKEPLDDAIVYGLLGAMGITLRAGVQKNGA